MKNLSRVQSPERKAPWGPRPFTESRVCGRRADDAFGGASYASPHSIPGLLSGTRVTRPSGRLAFTLVEMLVTLALLSLIVLALMTVFNSTQNAFRASLTQTDILESGRLAMGLITSDLATMTPSDSDAVNFYSAVTNFGSYTLPASPVSPLLQGLTASSQLRTNVLESFFSLSRQNLNGQRSWVATGYVVSTNTTDGTLYPLYRFYMVTNVQATDPWWLYVNFITNSFVNSPPWSHLADGVVDLRVRAFDANGRWITNSLTVTTNAAFTNAVTVYPPYLFAPGDPSVLYMSSNVVPASVEVEMGVLEDTTLQRAESLSGAAQMNYLSNHVGQVHLFRQRVAIRNVDPAVYQ